MTGMPAFGPTHNDQDLWELVAFIRQLPKLRPGEYVEMIKETGLQEQDDHGHQHTHG